MRKHIEAPIFDIQRFSIHDGPGIRTLIFFKGCFLKCQWCQNPESQDREPVVAFYANRCQESFHCRDTCPENAILSKGFRVDYTKCTLCGKCIEACAYGALKLVGDHITPEALFSQILLDLPYYQKSGGGVTFSGGEPTHYPEFLEKVLNLCLKKEIHMALETCGSFSFKRWAPILRKLDLIYFDLKIINASDHLKATGFPNRIILSNASSLVKENFPVVFRMPLVEGYTDTKQNIQNTILFLKEIKVASILLLTYHNMGETKIDIIQGSQKKLNLSSYSEQSFEKARAYFNEAGIEVSGM